MNLTESAIIAVVVLALSGSALWIGGKVMGQVEAHTAFVETVADPALDAEQIAQVAKREAAIRQDAARQIAKVD